MGLAKGHKAKYAWRCRNWSRDQLKRQLEFMGATSPKGRLITAELKRRREARIKFLEATMDTSSWR